MENNKDKPYSLQDAKTRLNKKLFCSLYNKIEELRKENEILKQERFIESKRVIKDEAEIERLKESNKELVDFLNYNLEESKHEVQTMFIKGWIAALLHVKINFAELKKSEGEIKK